MADSKYLDLQGVKYLWSQIKGAFVAKETGKGLSANDFTNDFKTKLEGIAEKANNYVHPSVETALGAKGDSGESRALSFGGKFDVLNVTVDKYGHVTAAGTKTLTLPAAPDAYDLPAATTTALGGVIVGDGLEVDATGKVGVKAAISNVTGLQSALDDCAKSADVTETLKSYTTTAALNTALADYTTTDNMNTKFGNYTTTTDMNTKFGNYTTTTDMNTKFGNYTTTDDLEANYAKKSDLTNVYKYVGSVASFDKLPSADVVAGSVYNVVDTGMNYAWTGTAWDALGMTLSIARIENTDIDDIINGNE